MVRVMVLFDDATGLARPRNTGDGWNVWVDEWVSGCVLTEAYDKTVYFSLHTLKYCASAHVCIAYAFPCASFFSGCMWCICGRCD